MWIFHVTAYKRNHNSFFYFVVDGTWCISLYFFDHLFRALLSVNALLRFKCTDIMSCHWRMKVKDTNKHRFGGMPSNLIAVQSAHGQSKCCEFVYKNPQPWGVVGRSILILGSKIDADQCLPQFISTICIKILWLAVFHQWDAPLFCPLSAYSDFAFR